MTKTATKPKSVNVQINKLFSRAVCDKAVEIDNMSKKDKKKGFTLNEKLEHYSNVASGEKAVKADSKFTEAEQRAYARGQRDARNESRRVWKSKNATAVEKQAYKDKKAAERAERKAKKGKGAK